jgi:hypothetical protein
MLDHNSKRDWIRIRLKDPQHCESLLYKGARPSRTEPYVTAELEGIASQSQVGFLSFLECLRSVQTNSEKKITSGSFFFLRREWKDDCHLL